jgi:hypothetical protein
VAAHGHRILGNQIPFLDQGLSANQTVDHFRFETAADVPNARGLRDWDLSEPVQQGLPFPREVDADLPPKLLKQNLQLPLSPRKDDLVSFPYSHNSIFLGEVREPRPVPPLLRRLGRLRDPLHPARLLNGLLALPDFAAIVQSTKQTPVICLPRPPPLASKGRPMALAILLAGPRRTRTSLRMWMQPGSVLSEPIWTCITNVLRTVTI